MGSAGITPAAVVILKMGRILRELGNAGVSKFWSDDLLSDPSEARKERFQ